MQAYLNGHFWLNKYQQTLTALQQHRRYRLYLNLFGGSLLAVSVLFLSTVLLAGWKQVQPYLRQMDLLFLLAGQGCTILAVVMGGFVWFFVMRGFACPVAWQHSLQIHMRSNITKYMPGYAWQYMSKAYLSKRYGLSARGVTFALLTELGMVLSSGIASAAFVGGVWHDRSQLPWTAPKWLWLTASGITIIGTVGWMLCLPRLINSDEADRDKAMRPAYLCLAWVSALIGWLLYAAACWFSVRSLYPITLGALPQNLVAIVGASLVSLLVIVIPGGLGVKEATLTTLLAGLIPLTIGAVVSILSRLLVITSEIFCFFLIIPFYKGRSGS